MKENISPEERLLKLIKGKKPEPAAEKKAPATVPQAKHSLKASPAGQTSPLPKKRIYSPLQNSFSRLKIKKIIFIGFIVACVYLVASFIYPIVFPKKYDFSQFPPGAVGDYKIDGGFELKPYEFYSDGVSGRQIFNAQSSASASPPKPAAGVNIDLLKDVNLLGIISGDNPQVVIEDKKTQKSYYLSQGQFFGEFKIEEIQEGKVILSRNGERFELSL